MESRNKATAAIVTLAVGLLVGGGAGYLIADMNKGDSMSNTNQSSEQASMDSESDGVTVGGAKMVKDQDIVENASRADNVSTLVSAVEAADLVDTLKGEGPFTVFGPNNAAFDKLPEGTLDTLLMPENKDQLAAVLTYHVVPGTFTSADLKAMAQKGETLTSVQGGVLKPVVRDGMVYIEDANGGQAMVETSDVISSNGVTHVIDAVLMQEE